MKLRSIILILALSTFYGYGQLGGWCGTDSHAEKMYETNPAAEMQMHEQLARITSGGIAIEERDGEYIIPVVVHVLHDNGTGNITYEQIQSGIDMLNEDFNRTNSDTSETRDTEEAPFKAIAANMNIRFELAKLDPSGDCTNGVERRNVGALSYNADDAQKKFISGGLDAWDRNYYFNIWTVNSIQNDGAGTILGYAQFPYFGSAATYGVIIRHDAYGTEGTASGDRTLTHEVGHCLGLLHTFQNGCHSSDCASNGDYCCDTPPVSEAHWSCSDVLNSCSTIPSGDYYTFDAVDQYENFMSYSPCQNMYSTDQKNIVIGNLASVAFLENLVDESHNASTGVGSEPVLCVAQFESDEPTICNGQSIQYYDNSYANIESRIWTFEGGTPASSTEENPIVTYETPGNYAVTLEVTDGVTSISTTKTDYVLVLSNPGTLLPYAENFEALTEIPDNNKFLIQNQDGGEPWKLTNSVGYSGTNSAFLKNYGVSNGSIDELISGTFDLSEIDSEEDIIFNFKYAYHKKSEDDDEWLRFSISKDCGQTWAVRKNIHGDALSEERSSTSYSPANKEEWTQVNITNINSDYYTADFRFKFSFENDGGNNIYIDDINFYPASMASVIEDKTNELINNLSLFPNPVSNTFQLTYSTDINEDINIDIYDLVGKKIETIFTGSTQVGVNNIQYSTERLTPGVYQIILSNNSGKQNVIKLIKE